MKLTEELTNELIELYEGEYSKQGVEAPTEKEYDWEFVKSAVKHYGYAMAYRAKKNKKDATLLKIGKALEKMNSTNKDAILKELGLNSH